MCKEEDESFPFWILQDFEISSCPQFFNFFSKLIDLQFLAMHVATCNKNYISKPH